MQIDKDTRDLLRDPRKRRIWIRYQLTLMGTTLAEVAAAAGVSRQCIYQVFNHTYPRMEKVIADALGMEPKQLWPERYGADGLPIYRMGRPKKVSCHSKHNGPRAARNVRKGVVA